MEARHDMAHAPTALTVNPTPRPTRVSGVFTVPSRTHAGEDYTTDVRDTERPTCTCPAGQHNFENCTRVATCWHVRACLDVQAENDHRDHARSRALIVRPRGMAALQDAFPG